MLDRFTEDTHSWLPDPDPDDRGGLGRLLFALLFVAAAAIGFVGFIAWAIGGEAAHGAEIAPQQQAALAELGKMIFFDKRLSVDGTTACASCHQPSRGWADGRAVAVGLIGSRNAPAGLVGIRNTPTILNASLKTKQFHDQRADSIYDQCLMPTENPIEMGNQTIGQVVNRFSRIAGYQQYFVRAFQPELSGRVTADRMRLALVAFMATIKSSEAPADYLAKLDVRPDNVENVALSAGISEAATRGWLTFKANCTGCHRPDQDFRDGLMHNVGTSFYARNSDIGGVKTTGREQDRFAFATATLRQLPATGPWGPHGEFNSLRDVSLFYNSGAVVKRDGRQQRGRGVDARIKPLGLDAAGIDDLTACLTECFVGTMPKITLPERMP